MSQTNAPFHDAFDRLQKLLVSMQAGEAVGPRDAARLTGLAEPTCRTVLERLAHVGLMTQEGQDRFVRVRQNP